MESDVHVSIGRAKRDISQLINRVAYGGERVVLTSRGKPKAVLISVADYELLRRQTSTGRLAGWQAWLAESDQLAEAILKRRKGEPLPVDELWRATREDLEARDDRVLGS